MNEIARTSEFFAGPLGLYVTEQSDTGEEYHFDNGVSALTCAASKLLAWRLSGLTRIEQMHELLQPTSRLTTSEIEQDNPMCLQLCLQTAWVTTRVSCHIVLHTIATYHVLLRARSNSLTRPQGKPARKQRNISSLIAAWRGHAY